MHSPVDVERQIPDKVKRTDPPAILIDDVIIMSSSHQHRMTSSSRDQWACRYKMANNIGSVSMYVRGGWTRVTQSHVTHISSIENLGPDFGLLPVQYDQTSIGPNRVFAMAVSPSNNVNSGRGKYPRGTPTLQTPVNPSKVLKKTTGVRKDASKFLEGRNTSHNSQRQLNFNGSGGHTTHPTWSIEEFKALAKYCVTEGREDMWPMHHNKQTWDSVGIILMNQTKTRHLRSGKYL